MQMKHASLKFVALDLVKNRLISSNPRESFAEQIPSITSNSQRHKDEIQNLNHSICALGQTLKQLMGSMNKTTNIPHQNQQIQHRDRKVVFRLPTIKQNQKLQRQTLELWISCLCKQVFSVAFHKFVNNQLNYDQAKVYCAQNIITNLILLSQKYQIDAQQLKIIDDHIHNSVTNYMSSKYPLTQTHIVNKAIEKVIKKINNVSNYESDMFYIFSDNSFGFQYRESGNYNDLIMKFINFLMKSIDQEIQIPNFQRRTSTPYQQFYQSMQNIFQKVEDKDWISQSEKMSTSMHFSELKQMEKDKYKSEVEKYTYWLIGRKVSQNSVKYSDCQIQNMRFQIKDPAILRILTKWCKQLLQKFDNNYFLQKIQNMVLCKGRKIIIAYEWLKQQLDEYIEIQKQEIDDYMQKIQKNNYNQQEIHLIRALRANSFTNMQKIERSAGLFTVNTVNNLHSYVILYLNRLIHSLLKVAKKVAVRTKDSKYSWNYPINLLTFTISDLMRCKIASKEREIYRLYKELKRISDQNPQFFKIVRVKDRLKQNTNDILVNIRFREKYLCEIQLAVKSSHTQFIDCSNQFNHFIYQLQRSIFGPITQLCSIWKSLDRRTKVYQQMVNKMIIKSDKNGKKCINNQSHELIQYKFPFICSECHLNYSQSICFEPHQICNICSMYWICGQCQLKLLTQEQLKDRLFVSKKYLKFKKMVRKIGADEEIPHFGICFEIQSKRSKLQLFKKCVVVEKEGIYTKQQGQIQLIAEFQKNKDIENFKKKYIIFQIAQNQLNSEENFTEEELKDKFLLKKQVQLIYNQEKDQISLISKGINDNNYESILLGSYSDVLKIKNMTLSDNNLTKISSVVNNFTNLQKLYVSNNKINDLGDLSKLKKLVTLDFRKNDISVLPQQLFQLKTLRELNLSANKMKQLPQKLGALSSLQILKVEHLHLQHLPNGIGTLKSLRYLDLSSNNFKSVPDQIKELSQLQYLNIKQNSLKQIPDWLCNLQKIKILYLNKNQLCKLPQKFKNMQLLELSLDQNHIQRLDFQLPKTLKTISIQKNQINWIDQLFFAYCVQLQKVDMSQNQIKEFPSSLLNCDNLIFLDLGNNKIQNLNQIGKVNELYLGHNPIKTMNNSSFLYPNSLFKIDISFTPLKEFPKELANCLFLSSLDLSGVQCSFKSLQLLKNFRYLQHLNISKMKLSNMPHSIKQLHYLSGFDVSHNNLTNFDQDFFKKLTYLSQINLSFNKISFLPKTFKCCKRLRVIDLSNNNLSTFPEIMYNNKLLRQIDLSSNKIQLVELDHNFPALVKILSLISNPIKQISGTLFKKKIPLKWLRCDQPNVIKFQNEQSRFKSEKQSEVSIEGSDVRRSEVKIKPELIPNFKINVK